MFNTGPKIRDSIMRVITPPESLLSKVALWLLKYKDTKTFYFIKKKIVKVMLALHRLNT